LYLHFIISLIFLFPSAPDLSVQTQQQAATGADDRNSNSNNARAVLTDKLGINSFHVNPETNVLVSASDSHSVCFLSSVVPDL
jgi:hypothetical protein